MIEGLQAIRPGSECVFPKAELDARVAAVQRAMAGKGLDLLLTSSAENIFYLTGQQTPGYYTFQCLAVPAEGAPFHMLRRLEIYNARANTYLAGLYGYDDDADPARFVAETLAAQGWRGKRVAVDRNAWFLTVSLHERLVSALGPLLDGSGLVEPLRRVKSAPELEFIEAAARANDAGMRAALAAVRAGATDNDLAAAAMGASIAAGGEYVGMEPLLSAGPRSGIPHATWRRRRIGPGDVAIVETAACWNRYHAALYRTAVIGEAPARAHDMYAVCLEALAAALAALRPGASCAEVHAAAQAVVDRHGLTDAYRKRTGYSVGISFAPDWGEGNILSLYRGVDVEIRPGMAFHLPISLRDYGRFTVAVSETAIVTDTGCRSLSAIPRDLVEA